MPKPVVGKLLPYALVLVLFAIGLATSPVAVETAESAAGEASTVLTGPSQGKSSDIPLPHVSHPPSITDISPIDGGRIENIDGNITYLSSPPVSVELWELESDSELFMFAEKQNHVLARDLSVDLSQPGDYFPDTVPEDRQTWEALNPGIIPAGTRVDSYYFHFDNKTYDDTFRLRRYRNCIGQYQVSGSVTFKNPVLGIAMRAGAGKNASLRRSDFELGLPGVDYCEHYLRHFPGINIADGCRSDRFILSADRRTLWLTNHTDIHHDNYRIIVEAERSPSAGV